MDAETDSASQRIGGRLPRYWAPQQARLERDRGLRRVKLGHTPDTQAPPPSKLSLPLPAFIPLQELDIQVPDLVLVLWPAIRTVGASFM